MTVLGFHRIRHDGAFSTRFDDDVFGPSVSELRRELNWLKTHFDPIEEKDLLDYVHKGTPLPPRALLLTFDDGYIDNYTLAFPLLKELRFPALFFIATDLIENRTLGWWDIIAYLLKESKKDVLSHCGTVSMRSRDLHAVIRHFQTKMKLSPSAVTQNLLAELSDITEVSLPSLEIQGRELMTWEQIRSLSSYGMGIGAHGKSHLVLATLSEEEQERELGSGKEVLESKLGKTVHTLAYPVGGALHVTSTTRALARRAGFSVAFCYGLGGHTLQESDPFRIPRLPCPNTLPMLAAVTAIPSLFGKS